MFSHLVPFARQAVVEESARHAAIFVAEGVLVSEPEVDDDGSHEGVDELLRVLQVLE